MFRQPKKHAASTSSKGSAGGEQKIIPVLWMCAPQCLLLTPAYAVKNENNFSVLVSFISKDVQPTWIKEYKITLGDIARVRVDSSDIIDEDLINVISNSFSECSDPHYAEVLRTLEEHIGYYLVNATADFPLRTDEFEGIAYIDICVGETQDKAVRAATCGCQYDSDLSGYDCE